MERPSRFGPGQSRESESGDRSPHSKSAQPSKFACAEFAELSQDSRMWLPVTTGPSDTGRTGRRARPGAGRLCL